MFLPSPPPPPPPLLIPLFSFPLFFLAAIETDKRLQDPNKFKHPVTGQLKFFNVAKTDYMVIQCNASNNHGYVFSDVYLNVLGEFFFLLLHVVIRLSVSLDI